MVQVISEEQEKMGGFRGGRGGGRGGGFRGGRDGGEMIMLTKDLQCLSLYVECHGNSMNQVIQVGFEEVEVVAVEEEEVDGQVGEVEDMVMVVMTSLTPWLCQVTRWDILVVLILVVLVNVAPMLSMNGIHEKTFPCRQIN